MNAIVERRLEKAASKSASDQDEYVARGYLGKMLGYWLLTIIAHFAYAMHTDPMYGIFWSLYPIVPSLGIGLMVGFLLRSVHATFQIAIIMLQIEAVFTVFQLLAASLSGADWDPALLAALKALVSAFLCIPRLLGQWPKARNQLRLGAAILAAIGGIAANWQSDWLHREVLAFAGRFIEAKPVEQSFGETLPTDTLWEQQPGLLAAASKPNADAVPPGARSVYLISLALNGRDDSNRREAKQALATIGQRFGERTRMSVLLSNNEADALQTPLATMGHLDRVVEAVASDNRAGDGLLVVYVATNRIQGAEAWTSMFDSTRVQSLSAQRLDLSLRKSNAKSAIVIISGCYSGNFIPYLKDDNRIVIASSSSDKDSFRCSPDRPPTLFSDFFLTRDLAEQVPLASVFDRARKALAQAEARTGECASDPQVHVGANMAALWDGEQVKLAAGQPCAGRA